MIIFTAGVKQIRETYFNNVPEDSESFPSVNRAGWQRSKAPPRNWKTRLLRLALKNLGSHQILWYSDEHLAAFRRGGMRTPFRHRDD